MRRAAIGKAMHSIDLGAELNAEVYVFWGGREGTEAGVAKDPRDALERYREAIDVLGRLRGRPGLRPALRDRAQAQRAARGHLPADRRPRAALHQTLSTPRWSASTRRSPTRRWPGCRFIHGVGQALWAGKLFHIDLNAQRIGRYDQDFRFGAEDLKEAFLLVRLLERAGYAGPRHFDAHAYRNEDADGVWDFARGCMRTYRALAERARALRRAARGPGGARGGRAPSSGGRPSTRRQAEALKAEADGLDALAARGYGNERLDQLVVDVLLGAR